MNTRLTTFVTLLILVFFVPQTAAFQATSARSNSLNCKPSLIGRWLVKFSFTGQEAKNLIFDSQDKGSGSFLLLDTAPDSKSESFSHPAAWAQLTNDRFSLSAEVELPIGTCCREVGTLIFKGKFDSSNSISGKLIFVTSVDEEESPYKFRSMVGTFIGARM